jgi:hypothetical protein
LVRTRLDTKVRTSSILRRILIGARVQSGVKVRGGTRRREGKRVKGRVQRRYVFHPLLLSLLRSQVVNFSLHQHFATTPKPGGGGGVYQ